MSSIRFAGIEKRYGDVHVLRGIDLDIASGELVVLLGKSGCGKSTLLRILAGLEEPTAGDVFIDGKRATHLEPGARGVSMVFQSYALFPHMTVEENLAFPLTIRRAPREVVRERVAAAARTLGIEDLLPRLPRQLSGGQRQRVAIGRALVREPDVTLFDEPLSNLDAGLRARMRVELKSLHERLGKTMVYVTHDQVEAMTLADRIVIMDEGRIRQAAPPAEVYRRPADTFVARFVGTPPMNLVEGEVRKGVFHGGPLAIALDPALRAPDGPATLGVRPEDIEVVRSQAAVPGEAYEAVIEVVEPIGDRGHLHLRVGDLALTATVEGSRAFTAQSGDAVAAYIAGDVVHLFGADGRRIG